MIVLLFSSFLANLAYYRIRPLYVFEKTVATFGTFTLLYTITEHYIMPLTPTPDQPFWRSMLDLALPFMVSAHITRTL